MGFCRYDFDLNASLECQVQIFNVGWTSADSCAVASRNEMQLQTSIQLNCLFISIRVRQIDETPREITHANIQISPQINIIKCIIIIVHLQLSDDQ